MTKHEEAGYKDTGCELEPSCLNCQRPFCKDDKPYMVSSQRKAARNKEINQLFATGKSRRAIADELKVSLRTVHRALKAKKQGRDDAETEREA